MHQPSLEAVALKNVPGIRGHTDTDTDDREGDLGLQSLLEEVQGPWRGNRAIRVTWERAAATRTYLIRKLEFHEIPGRCRVCVAP